VRLAPLDLDPAQLVNGLHQAWGLHVDALQYVAIGGGSHHWDASTSDGKRLWLSVDDLQDKPFLGGAPEVVRNELQRALRLARVLRDDARLEFVVAPLPTRGGEVLWPVGTRYALAVYPFLQGRTLPFGQPMPSTERQQLVDMLKRLHSATPLVGSRARRVHVDVDQRDVLVDALYTLGRRWSGGPLSEPARELLAAHATAVERVLAEFDRLAFQLSMRAAPLVISHGEPHPGNVLVCDDDRLLLLDWDTLGLAPPERDLWWLSSSDDVDAFVEYSVSTGIRVDPGSLRLYRLRWLLDDLVYCVRTFMTTHSVTVESEHVFATLLKSVDTAEMLADQDG
jgi:spectinomycin phosphotransferase